MSDPYKVLGISPDADDTEVKKAYRKLCRIYHPDANVNNPNAAEAEEKFKEVQNAYQQIIRDREQGIYGGYQQNPYGSSSQGGYSQGGYYQNGSYQNGYYQNGSAQDGYQQYRDPFEEIFGQAYGRNGAGYQSYQSSASNWQRFYAGEDLIRMQAAASYINNRAFPEALNALDSVMDRQAPWYYFCSLAHSGMGNNINALNYARRAAEMDPSNIEYQNLIHLLENGGRLYQARSTDFGGMHTCSSSNLCCYCLLANMCCGGGLPYICCI